MNEELLRKFSRENFDDASYVPLLHGQSETVKPLSLIIKQKRPKGELPFAKDEIIILAGLENFVSSDFEKEYMEAVKLKVIDEQVMEKGENTPVDSHWEINLDNADIGEIKLTNDDSLGDLLLGRVGQKYILDPDLRGILSCAVLDADKMIPYQDQELFLITCVVYSEKFEIVGKRKQEWEIEAGLEPPSQFAEVLKSKLHAKYKGKSIPPGVAKRSAWGPILFKYCSVQYNKEIKTLEIMKGEFIGRCKCHGDAEAFNDDDDEEEEEEDDNNDDVDNDDRQIPVDVVADILPELSDEEWRELGSPSS